MEIIGLTGNGDGMLSKRKELRIPYLDFQKLLKEFTLSDREFTAYSADKLEWILYYHSKALLRNSVHYAKFDTETNELVFLYPIDYIEPVGGLLPMVDKKLLESGETKALDKPSSID